MRTLTNAVLAVLTADDSDVGDGTGEGLTPPFRVLYPITQRRDGTLGDAWSDVAKSFQVTCEGTSRQQAEWWADYTDQQLLASDLVVTLLPRPEVVRDDTTGDPSRWKAYPRYQVRTFALNPDGFGLSAYGTSGYGG